MKLLLALLSAMVLAACAHAPAPSPLPPPGPSAALVADVDAARAEAKALLVQQAKLAWRNWTLGDPLDLAQTYAGHEKLFSHDTLAEVRELQAETSDPELRRALGIFRVYLSGEAIGHETAALSDQIATIEAGATFNGADGVEHPYRELERLTASERDHTRRVALDADALPVVDRLSPLLEQKEELTRKLLPDLGYPTYEAYATDLREVNLTELATQADAVLTRTDALYRTAMDRELQAELGQSLSETRRADISRFNRSADLDAAFPADRMIGRLRETLSGLGIDLSKQTSVRIDDAQLPSKNPRAACFGIQVPGDIRVSVKPAGGVTGYRAFFHEMGHAERYANTKTPYFELAELGDNAALDAYAFLFEGLIENPLWLADHTGLSGAKLSELVRSSVVKRLFLLRRYAGKLLFELAWHGGGQDPAALYRMAMTRAYGFPVTADDARRYLVDHDELFAAADYFRGWFLAAQIEARLVREGGERWWTSPKAGAVLEALWAGGNRMTVDDLAKSLGDPGLELDPLLKHFEAALAPQHVAAAPPAPAEVPSTSAAPAATPPPTAPAPAAASSPTPAGDGGH